MRYLITERSANAKTGPIMVTTSSQASCPTTCPLMANGCYAATGPLGFIWKALTSAEASGADVAVNGRGKLKVHSLDAFLSAIKRQKRRLWRHNQAGDLAHTGGTVDVAVLDAITRANKAAKAYGFTYTHHDVESNATNAAAIQEANANGFTVNLSANTLAHADTLAALGIAPVVVVLAKDERRALKTPQGRHVAICPAVLADDVSCASCGLCALPTRKAIIGFPAHGTQAKRAEAVTQF